MLKQMQNVGIKENRYHPYSRQGPSARDRRPALPAPQSGMGMGAGAAALSLEEGFSFGTHALGINVEGGRDIDLRRNSDDSIVGPGARPRRGDTNTMPVANDFFSDDVSVNFMNFDPDPGIRNTRHASPPPDIYQENMRRPPAFNPSIPAIEGLNRDARMESKFSNQGAPMNRFADTAMPFPSEDQLFYQELNLKVREKIHEFTINHGSRPNEWLVKHWREILHQVGRVFTNIIR